MYHLVTGQNTKGFVYIDVLKEPPVLGGTYTDTYGNKLRIVEFYNIESHREFVKSLISWRQEAKKLNLCRDPEFKSRKQVKKEAH